MSDETGRLFSVIEEKTQEYTDLWVALCSRETRSDDQAALSEQADFLEDFAKTHGLQVVRKHHPHGGDALILTLPELNQKTGTHASTGAAVAILGHMDTVHEKGAFGDPVVRVEGDTIYGPGVADMKGGLVVGLLAMEALRVSGAPHPEIRMVINPDEESGEHIGMEARRALFVEGTKGCKAAFNCETGCPGQMTVGRKGVIRAAIDVTGIGAHAGNDYFKGASAIREMTHKIQVLEQKSDIRGMTFNCGIIQGGTVVNIVPTNCHMEMDIRYLTNEQYEEALRIVEEVTATSFVPGTTATWKLLHHLPAMEDTPGNRALFEKVAAFASAHHLEALTPIVRGGGSDSAYTVAEGIPTVCSMGAIGDYVHTTREYAVLSSLPLRAKILAGVISELDA